MVDSSAAPSTLVIVPTYDEADNIADIVSRVTDAVPDAHVLVVDDGSPDGTGDIVSRMADADDRVHLLRRAGKLGLGTAYVAGFRWGLERGFDLLVEMDADGSHPVSRLPALIDAVVSVPPSSSAPGVALAIGSRWTPGGSVVDWPRHRELLSRGGNAYARAMLGIDVRDITAGFRVYRAETIRAMDLDAIDSKGYCFQVDMTIRVHDQGGAIVEVPIQFRDRVHGTSKMSQAIVVEAMLRVTQWGIARRFRRGAGAAARTAAARR